MENGEIGKILSFQTWLELGLGYGVSWDGSKKLYYVGSVLCQPQR